MAEVEAVVSPTARELSDLPRRIVEQYERIMERRVSRFRDHPNYLDMLSFVRCQVWISLKRLPPEKWDCAQPFVRAVTEKAILNFLRSPENVQRTQNQYKRPVPEVWQLDTMVEQVEWSTGDNQPFLRYFQRLVTPDFAPGVIDRLWHDWLWQQVVTTLPTEQVRAVRDMVTGRRTYGKNERNEYNRVVRSINPVRRALGAPVKLCPPWTRAKQERRNERDRSLRAARQQELVTACYNEEEGEG